MADYYDRLEIQLAQLTASGAHRRRPRWRWPTVPRLRLELVAVAAAVLVVVAVGVVLLSAGTSHRPSHQPTTVTHGPPLIHNYYPGPVPPPSGSLVCNADLEPPGTPPGIERARHGMLIAYNKPPIEFELTITATGLKPNAGGDVYALWVLPAVSLTSGGNQVIKPERPQLLGVIKPGVGSNGKLAAQGIAPTNAPSDLELLVTLQPHGSVKRPGRVVLSGFATL
jgi:hypothetical protein